MQNVSTNSKNDTHYESEMDKMREFLEELRLEQQGGIV